MRRDGIRIVRDATEQKFGAKAAGADMVWAMEKRFDSFDTTERTEPERMKVICSQRSPERIITSPSGYFKKWNLASPTV